MFSLDGTVKYWLYNKPVDMRKSFNGLSGIETNGMCSNFRNGDMYIFMNASRNMMKMLRREEGGLVLYAIRMDGADHPHRRHHIHTLRQTLPPQVLRP